MSRIYNHPVSSFRAELRIGEWWLGWEEEQGAVLLVVCSRSWGGWGGEITKNAMTRTMVWSQMLWLAVLVLVTEVFANQGGKFRRVDTLFPSAGECDSSREFVIAISAIGTSNMLDGLGYMEDSSARGTDNNAQDNAVAGLTYLGQLLSHDIAKLEAGDVEEEAPERGPNRPVNAVTLALDLDTLYSRKHPRDPLDPAMFLMGNPDNPLDYPRDMNGKALIGDERNDEHTIISQLSALFIRFHNKVVQDTRANCRITSAKKLFRFARKRVVEHYQSIILTDWLPLFVPTETIDDILTNGRKLFVDKMYRRQIVPAEFIVGTHRLGHSIARGRYRLNGDSPDPKRIFPLNEEESLEINNLVGGRFIPPSFNIEWNRFFNFSDSLNSDIADDVGQFDGLQVYRQIDQLYARPMMRLPIGGPGLPTDETEGSDAEVNGEPVVSLATLDLLRGKSLGLPCGRAAAMAAGAENVLTIDDFLLNVSKENGGAGLGADQVPDDVPFLLYILREAKVQKAGERLGELGARIEGEVILGALEFDQKSVLNQPGWTSKITGNSNFRMVDMINYVEGDISIDELDNFCAWN